MGTDIIYKEMDLSGGKKIGSGQCSDVLAISDDRVVKLYQTTIPDESIIRECAITQAACRNGLSSVKCYGLVKYGERTGIELEWIKGINFDQAFLMHPEKRDIYAKEFAENLLSINSSKANLSVMPSASEFHSQCIDKCWKDHWISDEERKKLHVFLDAIPKTDTMLHGDYHVLNMMLENDKIRMIDLADCLSGHAVFDLLVADLYLHFMPMHLVNVYNFLFKIPPEQAVLIWDVFLKTYFHTNDEARINKIKVVIDKYCMFKLILAPYSFSNLHGDALAEAVGIGRERLMPDIDKYTGIIPKDISLLCRE